MADSISCLIYHLEELGLGLERALNGITFLSQKVHQRDARAIKVTVELLNITAMREVFQRILRLVTEWADIDDGIIVPSIAKAHATICGPAVDQCP